MSEETISISNLNDFIFCPISIYFHQLDGDTDKLTYQDKVQICGSAAHSKVDNGDYSDKKTILQAINVFSEKYGLFGKIDIFDSESGTLTERKKKIVKIYDGYIFQLYAQCFCLREMNYKVKQLRFYSMEDNKTYNIELPEDDEEMFIKFESTIDDLKNFSVEGFEQDNPLKCKNCIYEPLCSYSVCEDML